MTERVSLLLGGDIQFDRVIRPSRRVFDVKKETNMGGTERLFRRLSAWYFNFSTRYPSIPVLIGKMTGGLFQNIHKKWIVDAYSNKYVFPLYYLLDCEEHLALYKKLFPYKEEITAQSCWKELVDINEKASFPFQGIRALVKEADLAFANLECPLSNNGRILGMFRADPIYAEGLAGAGFTIMSVANNHMFDAGKEGFEETLEHLDRVGIHYIGGGRDMAEARKPVIEEIKGYRIGFLAYTQFSDNGFAYDIAGKDGAGILPFSMPLILEDIRKSRRLVDILVISLHWLSANTPFIHQKARECAHKILDVGGDIIVGHHPHVYKAVEIYKGKLILYSLGNLIFGHSQTYWGHNLIAKIKVDVKKIQELELIPISGVGDQLFQPSPLVESEAGKVLDHLSRISAPFGTQIRRVGDRGIISSDAFA
jgi:poly-gamma-glutamate capsule biosynthesis protein CapA/YwtB (metallophosphatase superfamily)